MSTSFIGLALIGVVLLIGGWVLLRIVISLAGLFAGMSSNKGEEVTITCMKCHQQTSANQLKCTHCGYELR